MDFLLNNIKYHFDKDNTTLFELKDYIESKCLPPHHLIKMVMLDNKEIDINDDIELPNGSSLPISFVTANKYAGQENLLKTLEKITSDIIDLLDRSAQLIRETRYMDSIKTYVFLIQDFEIFVNTLIQMEKAYSLDYSQMAIGKESIGQNITRLNQTFKEMFDAQNSKDWVLLGDLLEYEIKEIFIGWRQYFPRLRKIVKKLIKKQT